MSTFRGILWIPLQLMMRCRKGKTVWDTRAIEYFIQACLDQVFKGEHVGTSFTKKKKDGKVSFPKLVA